MIRAIGTPMPSPLRRSVCAVWLKSLLMLAVPVTSVSNPPLPSAAWTIACTLSMFFSAWVRSPAMTTGMMAVWPSAEMSVGVAALVGAERAVHDARAEGGDLLLQPEHLGAEGRACSRSAPLERTMTTSLAFCGMFRRCCSRSRPRCESGLPRKVY